jgi:hypothetical protein
MLPLNVRLELIVCTTDRSIALCESYKPVAVRPGASRLGER